MPTIGFTELLIILALALLIFGPKSIPKIGKAIGDGLREFKRSQNGRTRDDDKNSEDEKKGDRED